MVRCKSYHQHHKTTSMGGMDLEKARKEVMQIDRWPDPPLDLELGDYRANSRNE